MFLNNKKMNEIQLPAKSNPFFISLRIALISTHLHATASHHRYQFRADKNEMAFSLKQNLSCGSVSTPIAVCVMFKNHIGCNKALPRLRTGTFAGLFILLLVIIRELAHF